MKTAVLVAVLAALLIGLSCTDISLHSRKTKHSTALSPNQRNTGAWTNVTSSQESPIPRYGAGYVNSLYQKKQWILFGGSARKVGMNVTDELYFNDVWSYDVSKKSWASLAALYANDAPRGAKGSSAVLVQDKVVIFGGQVNFFPIQEVTNQLAIFDLKTRSWVPPADAFGDVPAARTFHSAVNYQDKVYIFGGEDTFLNTYFDDLWEYDISVHAFRQIPTKNGPGSRTGHVATILEDRMFVFGGRDNNKVYNDTWVFDFKDQSWRQLSTEGEHPTPRTYSSACLFNENWWIFGGANDQQGFLDDIYVLSIVDEPLEWSKAIPVTKAIPTERIQSSLVADSSGIFMFSGQSYSAYQNKDVWNFYVLQ